MLFTYHIKVVGDKADVTRDPQFDALQVSQDDVVQFSSDHPDTVIRYRATSPFGEAEVGPNKIFDVGNGMKGPFRAVNADKIARREGPPSQKHHFDCGFRDPGAPEGFRKWRQTDGDDTPVDP